jgi:hypothetical protein
VISHAAPIQPTPSGQSGGVCCNARTRVVRGLCVSPWTTKHGNRVILGASKEPVL